MPELDGLRVLLLRQAPVWLMVSVVICDQSAQLISKDIKLDVKRGRDRFMWCGLVLWSLSYGCGKREPAA